MIYFLVDRIEKDGLLGLVFTLDKILHNLQRFGMEYFNKLQKMALEAEKDGVIDIMPCGRFICIIQLTKDKSGSFMFFVDTGNNYDEALKLSSILLKYPDGNKYQQLFLTTFKEMESSYEKQYYDAKFSLDSLPLN